MKFLSAMFVCVLVTSSSISSTWAQLRTNYVKSATVDTYWDILVHEYSLTGAANYQSPPATPNISLIAFQPLNLLTGPYITLDTDVAGAFDGNLAGQHDSGVVSNLVTAPPLGFVFSLPGHTIYVPLGSPWVAYLDEVEAVYEPTDPWAKPPIRFRTYLVFVTQVAEEIEILMGDFKNPSEEERWIPVKSYTSVPTVGTLKTYEGNISGDDVADRINPANGKLRFRVKRTPVGGGATTSQDFDIMPQGTTGPG